MIRMGVGISWGAKLSSFPRDYYSLVTVHLALSEMKNVQWNLHNTNLSYPLVTLNVKNTSIRLCVYQKLYIICLPFV